MKPKPQAPEDLDQKFTARTVTQLIEALKKLPPEATVYGTDDGEVAVFHKRHHIAHIDLVGY